MSLKSTLAVSAALAAVCLVVITQFVRAWLHVARLSKRNEEFGERFKRSGFSELASLGVADTLPASLDGAAPPTQ